MAKRKDQGADPKTYDIKADIKLLNEILGPGTDKLSPLGHKLTSDSGKMDAALLSGTVTINGLMKVCGTSNTSKRTRESEPHRAKRPKDHFTWVSRTAGKKGKGVDTRLKHLHGSITAASKIGKKAAPILKRISQHIVSSYNYNYGKKAQQSTA